MRRISRIYLASFFFILLCAFSLLGGMSISEAQVSGSIDGIDIESNPPHPGAGSEVTVSVTSFSTDLNRADITWFLDGTTTDKGPGKTSITLTTSRASKPQTVIATIKTAEGREVRKVLRITPAEVNILWESDGFTPPFYKGKAPYVHQGTIKFIAMPNFFNTNGTAISQKDLYYKWKQDYKVLGNQSGIGKQSLILQGNITQDPIQVSVEVSTKDSNIIGEAGLVIDSSTPSILFYKESPLYGVLYNNVITDSVNLMEKDTKIKAVPYSFSWNDKTEGNLEYTWLINTDERTDLNSSDTVNLSRNEDQAGNALISLRIRNINNILQSGDGEFRAFYTKVTQPNAPAF